MQKLVAGAWLCPWARRRKRLDEAEARSRLAPEHGEKIESIPARPEAAATIEDGKAGISAEMPVRLATAFGGGAEAWLRMQSNYDLAQVKKREREIVATVRPVPRPEAWS